MALCTTVGFTGKGIAGSILLALGARFLREATPAGGCHRDWTGELGNQLTGRFKNLLSNFGTVIVFSIPAAFRAKFLAPPDSERIPEPWVFTTERGGSACLWIDLLIEPEVALSDEPVPEESAPLSEGELLLF